MGGRGRGRGRGEATGGFWSTSSNQLGTLTTLQDCKPSGIQKSKSKHKEDSKQQEKVPCHNEEKGKGERKFAEACREIQQSVDQYLATHQYDDQDDDDEDVNDDFEEDHVLDRILSSYEADKSDIGRTSQYLQDAFKSGALVCLICIDTVKKNDPIWNCEECYTSFHINCIQKWAKDSVYFQAEAVEDNEKIDRTVFKWCCPKCRSEYGQSAIPSTYKCFCTKTTHPKFDPWLIPHSCGENCRKDLKPVCGHQCLLLCHPGPCPPCPKTVTSKCFCGKKPPQTRRCCSKTWSCGGPCGGLLSCGQHPCTQPCHPDSCAPCPRQSKQKCYCGSREKLRDCASPRWQCEKVCSKRFKCGHHTCQSVCHEGACGDCPSSGLRTCPCGKTSHSLPCTLDIPPCGDTCGKTLACGEHYCAERCHKGPCPTCLQFRIKQCRCGFREKEIACSKEFTCDIKCKNLKDCMRHPCNKKCCRGDCQLCEHPCGRSLVCRNHKCESRCHQGPCYPCPVTYVLACRCGLTKITVPCGREKTTKPPKCNKFCKIPTDCHHTERERHKCHQGPCPTCRQVCDIKLVCSHICPAECHDVVPTKVVDNKRRVGPWEKVAAPRIVIEKKLCPPCLVPVATTCYGKHETPQWPCSDLRPYSCGRKCGRTLACTNHNCQRDCHMVDAADSDTSFGKSCVQCTAVCSKPRPGGCNHGCGKACHPGDCAPCVQVVKIKCHCSLNQLYIKCCQWTTESAQEKDITLSCKNQCNKNIACGHRCQNDCHSGPCSVPASCRKRVAIRCSCKRQRKDVLCTVVGKTKLLCDAVCLSKMEEEKKALIKEEQQKKLDEEARQKRELEEFERKMEGRKNKRRQRRTTDTESVLTFWDRYGKLLLSLTAVIIGVGGYIIINQ